MVTGGGRRRQSGGDMWRMGVTWVLLCLLGMTKGRSTHTGLPYTEEVVEVLLTDAGGRQVPPPVTIGHPQHTRYRRSAASALLQGQPHLTLTLRSPLTKVMTLYLSQKVKFASPGARLEWFEMGSNSTVSRPIQDGCLYHAELDNHTHYGGYVSLCDSVTGVIETPEEDLFIMPREDSALGASRQVIRHYLKHRDQKGRSECTSEAESHLDFREFETPLSGTSSHESKRGKRDLYRRGPKYIEVLLATDLTVEDFHGHSLMEQYLLTQMNIVNMAYQHESIGVDIRIVVNKIVIIPEDTAEDIVSEKTGKSTLDKFCRWVNMEQQLRFPHEQSHDLAVYITRKDIGPAGYAPVTGMCNPSRSCTVNKDDGISSAFVIAHEMGHVMGLQHDGVGNDCDDDPEDGKIMASLVQASYEKYYWTTCSKERLARYIDHYHCLDNEPTNPKRADFMEPLGQSWSLNEQCRQEFGDDFKLCEAFAQLDPCEYLWCSTSESPMLCRTKRGPPLPGTECASEKWCMGGRCVWIDDSLIDGGWAEWSHWTECTRSCGTGVQTRRRRCNDPPPQNGGDECHGDSEGFQVCNRHPCGGVPTDFRAQQCAWLNHLNLINNRQHNWLPLENKNVSQLCRLTCISMETGDVIVTEENVIDGTQCSYEIPNDICIEGKCQAMGCDGVPNSLAREDQCGVCLGHNDRCGHETGLFDTRLVKNAFYKILTIPRGAREIFIQEMQSSSEHILAVKDPSTGHFFFNGNGLQGHSRQFVHRGTRFVYLTRRSGETLAARGPTLDEVIIHVYSKSNKVPVQVAWRFILPNELKGRNYMASYVEDLNRLNPTTTTTTTTTTATTTTSTRPRPTQARNQAREEKQNPDNVQSGHGKEYKEDQQNLVEKTETEHRVPVSLYEWRFVDWTPCSVTCGEGVERSGPICAKTSTEYLVADEYCNRIPNPGQQTRPCTNPDCITLSPYRWDVEPWTPCTETCGQDGSQARRVHCMHNYFGQDYPVDPVYCRQFTQPPYHQPCNRDPCPLPWRPGPWSECSVTCGRGRQLREVTCPIPNHDNEYVCKGPKPRLTRPCRGRPCPAVTVAPTTVRTTTLPTTTTETTTKVITTTTTSIPTRPTTTTQRVEHNWTPIPPEAAQSRERTTVHNPPLLTATRVTVPLTTPTTIKPTTTTATTTTRRSTSQPTSRPSTTTATSSRASAPRVVDNEANRNTCTTDKSFFCKMAEARNCHLPLYSSFCCASCQYYLR